MAARLIVPTAVVALTVGSLAACSAEATPSDGAPYAAEFRQARELALNDFQRDVLKDDRITDEEYRESQQRYVDCMQAAGMKVEVNPGPEGGYLVTPSPTAEQEKLSLQCSDETIGAIEALYFSVRANPQKEDSNELFVSCLHQNKLIDESITAEHWARYEQEVAAAAQAGTELPLPPGGLNLEDRRVTKCQLNPLGK